MAKKPTRKRKTPADPANDPNLFSIKIGGKWHQYDPLECLLALEAHDNFRLEEDPWLAAQPTKEGRDALRRTMEAIGDVFGLKGYRDGGFTVAERMQIISEFAAYCDVQKKSTEPTPTTSQTSELPPDSLPPPPLSEYTCSESESESESPSQSASVSDTP